MVLGFGSGGFGWLVGFWFFGPGSRETRLPDISEHLVQVGFGWLVLVGFWLIGNGPGQTHSKGKSSSYIFDWCGG
jgi:hypothetical protein